MKKFKNIILLLIVATVVATGFYAYTEYNRPTSGVSGLKAIADMQAEKLVAAFETDEAAANKKYLGKVIIVSGPVAEIVEEGGIIRNVIIGKPETLHKVSCLLDSSVRMMPIAQGQEIKIKGLCNGFLMDVELSRCMMIPLREAKN